MLKLWVMDKDRDPYMPILIKQSDLLELDDEVAIGQLPPTLALMFRKTAGKLLIESLGGSTAASLVGRFTVFGEDVKDLCRQLVNAEAEAHEDIIFADLGQVSDAHIDNINRRLRIYDYEIPINVYSTLPTVQQIRPDDLLISVRGNELIMESESLKKRVIPRFTSAYNPTKTDLSIFRLFCDLQHQGLKSGMSFELERLFPGMHFYPAVEYENVIISAAKWMFKESELEILKGSSLNELPQNIHAFRKLYGLPQWVMLGSFDQQLVFNLDDKDEAAFFVDCLKSEKQVTLKEFVKPDNTVMADGNPLAGQFIAFLKHSEKIYQGVSINNLPNGITPERNFMPGSEWLYLKIFCTPQNADRLLLNVIEPVLSENEGFFANWFFIRYLDKGYHLRLRIQATGINQGILLAEIKNRLAANNDEHLIKNYQADIYRREMERYGSDLIDEVEHIFCAGSELTLAHLKLRSHENSAITDFQLSLLIVFGMLEIAISNLDIQIAFLQQVGSGFLNEFTADKNLKMDLDKKYRELSSSIAVVFENDILTEEANSILVPYLQQLLYKWEQLSNTVHGEARHLSLLADIIHMHINRLFSFEQRKYELVIYYCLLKYLLSRKARNKVKLETSENLI
jgi:thiopeptide-type bacteriocin biosynthesis protein